MRRRILESEDNHSEYTKVRIEIPTENGIKYTVITGDNDNTVFFDIPSTEFPFEFSPISPNYFRSTYVSVNSNSSYVDGDSLNGKMINIYYYGTGVGVRGGNLSSVHLNGNTVSNDDPEYPSVAFREVHQTYSRAMVLLPVGYKNSNIMSLSMIIQPDFDNDKWDEARSGWIYINL